MSQTPARETTALSDRAIDNLRFIRETMERAGAFTAVPGWGGVMVGVSAVVAAVVATSRESASGWLLVWLAEGVVAVAIALAAMIVKARRAGMALLSGAGRKFAL